MGLLEIGCSHIITIQSAPLAAYVLDEGTTPILTADAVQSIKQVPLPFLKHVVSYVEKAPLHLFIEIVEVGIREIN